MLLPKSYAGSLQVALSTQTTTHTAQQPLNGLRTALKKISRSVNAAFSAVPVAKFEQQTAAAAVSANKAAKAQAKLASGTTKAAKAAKRSVAEFDELDRLQASLAESAGAAAASTTRKSSTATIKAADAEPPQLSPPALLNQQLQNFWATLQAVLAPAAALWDAAWQQMKTAALTVWQDLLGGIQLTWAEYGQPIAQSAALALENLQGIFTTLWQNVLQPILTNLMQILSTLWSSHLKPLWDDILLLVASVANCLLDLWNNLLAPVAKWIIATFGPAFAEVFNAIADVVGVAVGAIADAIDLAVVVLRGLADFLSAVFRGNWDAAWQAIGNTVSTVWDKMTNAIKTAVNGLRRCDRHQCGHQRAERVVVRPAGHIRRRACRVSYQYPDRPADSLPGTRRGHPGQPGVPRRAGRPEPRHQRGSPAGYHQAGCGRGHGGPAGGPDGGL